MLLTSAAAACGEESFVIPFGPGVVTPIELQIQPFKVQEGSELEEIARRLGI